MQRVAILEIKTKRSAGPAATEDVARELDHLKSVVASFEPLPLVVQAKWEALRTLNENLLDIEDAMRACQARQRFDVRFSQLARDAQALNDDR